MIDGYSQPGASANTLTTGDNAVLLIELNGAGAGGGANGLTLAAGSDGSTIKGLVIDQFAADGIAIVGASNNVITGNFIGVDPTGTAARGNLVGIDLRSGSSNNRIGGTTGAERNIISSNSVDGIQIRGASSNNVVQGNYIGLDVTGTLDLGNTNQGVAIFTAATNNTVGGTAAGAGNVISGNGGEGVRIISAGTTGNAIRGNSIYGNGSLGIDLNANGVTPND